MHTIYECEICGNRSKNREEIEACEAQGYKEPLPDNTPVLYKGRVCRVSMNTAHSDHTYSYRMSQNVDDNGGQSSNFIYGYTHESEFSELPEETLAKLA